MTRTVKAIVLIAVLEAASPAAAYGPQGHLVAGRLAAQRLCPAAEREVETLGGGAGLGELGLWADRIRERPRYAASAPWHYVNVDDDADLAAFVHPPEGDVLWAVGHFHAVLTGPAPRAERAEALRFLVHFVVDLHQPLHVGRADDRGGNRIDVTADGERMSLHRFWDTGAIELAGVPLDAYTREVAEAAGMPGSGDAAAAGRGAAVDPRAWAAESFALRDAVYDFDVASGRLTPVYLAFAERVTRERLALAALRLARMLNAAFCG